MSRVDGRVNRYQSYVRPRVAGGSSSGAEAGQASAAGEGLPGAVIDATWRGENAFSARSSATASEAPLRSGDAPPPLEPYNDDPESTLQLQNRLVELGYLTPAQLATGPGVYGAQTTRAVEEFQAANGLPPTGVADAATMAAMFAESAIPSDAYLESLGPRVTGRPLGRAASAEKPPGPIGPGGDEGAVEAVQDRLVELGYLTDEVKASGPGNYGPSTTEAVRNFQRMNGLPVTGEADQETLDRLWSSDAVQSQHLTQFYDPIYNPTGYSRGRADCGPTALSMALAATGLAEIGDDPQGLIDEVRYNMVVDSAGNHDASRDGVTGDGSFSPDEHGEYTYVEDMHHGAQAYGAESYDVVTMQDLEFAVSQGDPVVLLGVPNREGTFYAGHEMGSIPEGASHWVAVTGYNPADDTFVVNDPLSKEGVITVTRQELEAYAGSTITGIAVHDPSQAPPAVGPPEAPGGSEPAPAVETPPEVTPVPGAYDDPPQRPLQSPLLADALRLGNVIQGKDRLEPMEACQLGVPEVQQALSRVLGMSLPAEETQHGYYGPATTAAVEQFQAQQGLPVTGVVDSTTLAALDRALLAVDDRPDAADRPLTNELVGVNDTLQAVARGEQVLAPYDPADPRATDGTGLVQDTLVALGYMNPPGSWRGYYGPMTESAVRAFQVDHGLEQTGIVDRETALALDAAAEERGLGVEAITVGPNKDYINGVLGNGEAQYDALDELIEAVAAGEGNFDSINLDPNDPGGFSFGYIQWAQRPGSLNEILEAFDRANHEKFVRIFGGGDEAVAQDLLDRTRGGGDRIDLRQEPWISRFREAGRDVEFQRVQRDVARARMIQELDVDWMLQNYPFAEDGQVSHRALAMMADVANQHGNYYDAVAYANRLLAANPGMAEEEYIDAMGDYVEQLFPAGSNFRSATEARHDRLVRKFGMDPVDVNELLGG